MEQINHHTKINASENAVIWSQYVNDSMSRCILRYMLHDVKDEDIRDLLEFALELSETHLEKTKQFLSLENLPIQ